MMMNMMMMMTPACAGLLELRVIETCTVEIYD